MVNGVAAKGLIFRSARTFVADQVRICAADARRARCLVRIDHYFIISCFRQAVVIAARQYVAHIAALYGRIAVVYHKLVGLIEMALIVARRPGRFVVHNHLNAF